MRRYRSPVGPPLHKNQPERIFAIDMDGVREAARFLARAMHVLEAQSAGLLEGVLPCRHAACHHNHIAVLAVFDPAGLDYGTESPAATKSMGCCGHRFNAARPEP